MSLRGFCDLRMLPPQNPCHYVKALTIPICKLSLLNDEAILTYLLFKNIFFMFYKRDSATFKLLNH